MWQLEDLIRASNFDINLLYDKVISGYKENRKTLDEITEWYSELIISMKQEGLTKTGHLSYLNEIVNSLQKKHEQLIKNKDQAKYHELYAWAAVNIKKIKEKSIEKNQSEIEYALNMLYGVLMLRLKGKQISQETLSALATVSGMMAFLAKSYKENI